MRDMSNIFQVIAEKFGELGFYNFFLPWLITLAVIWGLLKKSKLFDSPSVSAVISLSVSTLVWGFLVGVSGTDISGPMSTFITQIALIIIGLMFVVIGGSLFYPDIFEAISEWVKNQAMLTLFLIIVVVLALISGMFKVIFTGIAGISRNILGLIFMAVLFMLAIMLLANRKLDR